MHTTAITRLALTATVAFAMAGCATQPTGSESPAAPASNAVSPVASPVEFTGDPASFTITSDDVDAEGLLANSVQGASDVTCSGDGESLHIAWSEPPAGTESIAVLFENLTSPFVYWARIDIDPAQGEIEHGSYGTSSGRELTNDVGLKYPIGPCPGSDTPDTVRVTVWALDSTLGSDPRTYVDLRDGVVGRELASATLEAEAIGIPQGD